MLTLESVIAKDTRGFYRIAAHHARELRDIGRTDILERHALAVEQAATDLSQRAKAFDKAIELIEREATNAIREATREREARDAEPYPTRRVPA